MELDDDGDSSIDRAESFVYDGENVVLVFDESSSLTHRYLHGNLTDQVFADETTSDVFWALADNQRTVRDVANYDPPNDATSVLNHRKFDSFGNITAESNSSVDFLFAYTGAYLDPDTGLQNHWHRWYDAQIGRWLSEDPIGFGAGDANINRYVGNSPTNGTDPTGLESWNYTPEEFGLHGDPSFWATNQPAEYRNWYRANMDLMRSRAIIAQVPPPAPAGAPGLPFGIPGHVDLNIGGVIGLGTQIGAGPPGPIPGLPSVHPYVGLQMPTPSITWSPGNIQPGWASGVTWFNPPEDDGFPLPIGGKVGTSGWPTWPGNWPQNPGKPYWKVGFGISNPFTLGWGGGVWYAW